jgi:serine/threonine protein kinase
MQSNEEASALVGGTLGGRYRLTEVLHRGLDTVYRAHDATLDRPVVVKVLARQADAGKDVERAFQREVRRLSRLYGDTVCRVLDYDVSGADDVVAGLPYLVMEVVEGRSVDALLAAEGPQSPHRAFLIVEGVAQALGEAHAEAVVHGDVKPANVFVAPAAAGALAVKLIDFEIALADHRRADRVEAHRADPRFMAPELSTGDAERVDARTDVYGLTLTLYTLLAGRPPFEGPTPQKVLLAQLRAAPPPLPGPPELPLRRALDAFVARGLAKAPAERFPDVEAWRAALHDVIYTAGDAAYAPLEPPGRPAALEPAPPAPAPAPPPSGGRWVAIAAVVLAAAAAAAWLALR